MNGINNFNQNNVHYMKGVKNDPKEKGKEEVKGEEKGASQLTNAPEVKVEAKSLDALALQNQAMIEIAKKGKTEGVDKGNSGQTGYYWDLVEQWDNEHGNMTPREQVDLLSDIISSAPPQAIAGWRSIRMEIASSIMTEQIYNTMPEDLPIVMADFFENGDFYWLADIADFEQVHNTAFDEDPYSSSYSLDQKIQMCDSLISCLNMKIAYDTRYLEKTDVPLETKQSLLNQIYEWQNEISVIEDRKHELQHEALKIDKDDVIHKVEQQNNQVE